MQRYHHLKVSTSQRVLLLGAYLLAAGTVYFCLSADFLKWSLLAALTVSAALEYRRLIRLGNLHLGVDPRREIIELQQSGQPYFYFKYKVYQTRWFAILRLVDQQTQRTLILNSDCFQSVECYRQLRFDLRQLERSDAA